MLSAIVTTHNAEATISRCLASLVFADEIIVVDSGSTDCTAATARQHGARVINRPWSGYGQQKNYGASFARGTWLLFVDADEEITPALANAIKAITNTPAPPQFNFYWLRIVTIFLNRPLLHLSGHNPRLFNQSAGRWNDALVHEQVITSSGQTVKLGDELSGLLSPPLLHHSHQTIRSYLNKLHRYTTLDAKQMFATSRHRSGRTYAPRFFLPYYLALRQLFKLLFHRLGFLDGLPGITWCFLSAYYELEMAYKLLHYHRSQKSPPSLTKHD